MQTREYQLTEEEARIIEAYRGMDDYDKNYIQKQLRVVEMCVEAEAAERREKMKLV